MHFYEKAAVLAAFSCLVAGCDPYSRYSEMSEEQQDRYIAAEKACRAALETLVGKGVLSRHDWSSGGDASNDSAGIQFYARKTSDRRFWFCEVYRDGTIFRLSVGERDIRGKGQIDLLPQYHELKAQNDD